MKLYPEWYKCFEYIAFTWFSFIFTQFFYYTLHDFLIWIRFFKMYPVFLSQIKINLNKLKLFLFQEQKTLPSFFFSINPHSPSSSCSWKLISRLGGIRVCGAKTYSTLITHRIFSKFESFIALIKWHCEQSCKLDIMGGCVYLQCFRRRLTPVLYKGSCCSIKLNSLIEKSSLNISIQVCRCILISRMKK